MYFEESLVFSESTRRVIVGVAYFALGTLTASLNLSVLSVIPDCTDHLPPHALTFFSAQLFANIFTVMSMSIPVPYMLAVNKSYFVNPILKKAPAVIYMTSAITAGALQFWSGVHRNLTVVFPIYTLFIFSNLMTLITIVMSFAYAVSCVIDIDRENNGIMHFEVEKLSWTRTNSEWMYSETALAYASLISLMIYALSICDLLYKVIYTASLPPPEENEEEGPPSPLSRLRLIILHLLSDCVFAFLILFPSLGNSIMSSVLYDLIRIYGLAAWPTISSAIHTPLIAHALKVRVRFVLLACLGPGQENGNGNQPRQQQHNRMRLAV